MPKTLKVRRIGAIETPGRITPKGEVADSAGGPTNARPGGRVGVRYAHPATLGRRRFLSQKRRPG
jgi:hypothetical protein